MSKPGGAVTALAVSVAISVLFYRSLWGMVVFPPVYLYIRLKAKDQKETLWKKEMQEQFMNGLQVLQASLEAGMSMENAWKEVEKESGRCYGKKSPFYLLVKEMNCQVALNVPIEQQFFLCAQKAQVEEMFRFAEILRFGKRSGGNWTKIIDGTIIRMTERYEAEQEIAVTIASKQMEQRIMNLIPLGLLAFLQVSAWDYMAVLYYNPLGVLCMTVCLVVYVLAMMLGEKIMTVEI